MTTAHVAQAMRHFEAEQYGEVTKITIEKETVQGEEWFVIEFYYVNPGTPGREWVVTYGARDDRVVVWAD